MDPKVKLELFTIIERMSLSVRKELQLKNKSISSEELEEYLVDMMIAAGLRNN